MSLSVIEFEKRVAAAERLEGKGATMAKKRFEKNGKQTARERIKLAIDFGSEFFELSSLAAFNMYGGETHSAGVVTGIGKINKSFCMIFSNEGAVKGGTWVEPSCRKVLRAQQIALACNLFCVYIVDSGGAFLPDQANVYPELFGRIFRNQAEMSSIHGLLQIAVVVGLSTAGGAYVPAMCDFVIITETGSSIFLAGPPLVKSATGEIVTAEDLGGGPMHTRVSGVADYLAKDENEALGPILKNIIQMTLSVNIVSNNLFSTKQKRILFESNGIGISSFLPSGRLLETWAPVSDEAFSKVAKWLDSDVPLVIMEKQWGFLNEGVTKGVGEFIKALARVKHKVGIVTGGTAALCISSKGFNPGFFFIWPDVKFETSKGIMDSYMSTAIINDDGIIHPDSTNSIINTCLQVFRATDNQASL